MNSKHRWRFFTPKDSQSSCLCFKTSKSQRLGILNGLLVLQAIYFVMFITTHQRSCEKVMFSVVSVHSIWLGRGPHVIITPITHDALEPTVQDPPPTWHPRYPLVTSGGHHWRPVQTCSLQAPLGLTSGGCWSEWWSAQADGTHPTGMFSS